MITKPHQAAPHIDPAHYREDRPLFLLGLAIVAAAGREAERKLPRRKPRDAGEYPRFCLDCMAYTHSTPIEWARPYSLDNQCNQCSFDFEHNL